MLLESVTKFVEENKLNLKILHLIFYAIFFKISFFNNISKADNFLGNCNIGNEGQYLNTALQLVDEFNFKTVMSKEKLFYCNLSNKTGITFTMIPYNKDFIGNGQYISIGQAGDTSCINFIIVDTKNLQSDEDQMLSVDLNNRTGNYDLSSNNFRSKYCN